MSLLLWGPPGTGKTTIASIVSGQTDRRFVEVSAVVGRGQGGARGDRRRARPSWSRSGRETVLFVDEVHRFSKAQQDALLPGRREPLGDPGRGHHREPVLLGDLAAAVALAAADAWSRSPTTTSGGARPGAGRRARAWTGRLRVERRRPRPPGPAGRRRRPAVADLPRGRRRSGAGAGPRRRSTSATAETAVDRAAVRYDRQGDQHYDVISAFIKSIRGSDVDAALHYLARMIEAGEDPRFIARRLVILASEDIGLADPTALTTAVAAAQAVQLIGMPEARLNLAQADDRAGPGAQVQRRDHGDRRRQRRRPRRQDRPGARRTCATRTTAARRSSGHGQGVPVRPRRALRHRRAAVRPRRRRSTPRTTSRPSLGAEAAVKERWERVRRIIRGDEG